MSDVNLYKIQVTYNGNTVNSYNCDINVPANPFQITQITASFQNTSSNKHCFRLRLIAPDGTFLDGSYPGGCIGPGETMNVWFVGNLSVPLPIYSVDYATMLQMQKFLASYPTVYVVSNDGSSQACPLTTSLALPLPLPQGLPNCKLPFCAYLGCEGCTTCECQ